MSIHPNIAEAASLLGDASRATILTHLLDGRFHTAGELAYMAAITPQTASFHLSKLSDCGWVRMEKHGRYRYYQLAGREIAGMLEMFLTISPAPQIRSLNQSQQMHALRSARTCYDHLAGELGVQLTQSMIQLGYLLPENGSFAITDRGIEFFTELGIDLKQLRRKRRAFAHACLDWSERQHHLGGALGHAMLQLFLNKRWIDRADSIRAVTVTEEGHAALHLHFDLQLRTSL